jgi:predicted RNase H-like HicB family nuclease
MKYTVIIEKGPTSYGAYIPDLPGCVAAGDTREEVVELITAAVVDHVELMAEHGEDIPEPTCTAIEVEVPAPQEAAAETGR